MKRLILVFLGLAGLCRADGPSAPASERLAAGVPMEVYVAPGRATTILFHTADKIAAISLASPVVTYKYDKALNQLEITPAVRTGGVETNLNLRIGDGIYVLLVKVVTDVRAQFVRTFDVQSNGAEGDEAGLGGARPLKPADVDLVAAARDFERAQSDPVFREAQPNLKVEAIGKRYQWNDCLIELVDLAQWIDRDLIVFRVQWVNRTNDALYLDSGQYQIFLGANPIPIIARYKVGTGAVIYPGQFESVYLAVQGYRLSRHNDWQLGLPPDSEAVRRLLRD